MSIIKTCCAITAFAGALLGLSGEARADFLVLCPTGGFTAGWRHTGGIDLTGPLSFDSSKELLIPPTRFLKCHIDADFLPSLSYPNPGQCGGTVNMSASSAVFNRPERFTSGPLPTEAIDTGDLCFLNADVNFAVVQVEMSEECESLTRGNGWECPDSAHQIPPPFSGIVEEAPAE